MNKYNELIGQLVEYRSESMRPATGRIEPNPVALGLIVDAGEDTESGYIRVEWLVNPHIYTLFDVVEINKFGLTLKDDEDWGL